MHVALLHVHRAFRHLEDADVALMRRAVVVVLEVARLGALAAAVAHAQIQGIAELHAGLRLVIRNGHLRAVLFPGLLLQSVQHDLQINGRKFLIMPLQEILDRYIPRPFGQGRDRLGKRRRAEHRAQALERRAAGEATELQNGGPRRVLSLIHALLQCGVASGCAARGTEIRSRGGSTGRTSGNAGACGS